MVAIAAAVVAAKQHSKEKVHVQQWTSTMPEEGEDC